MSATQNARTEERDDGPYSAKEKYTWGKGALRITKADPSKTWVTTYVTPDGNDALCQSVDDFMMHVMQESAVREMPAMAYFEDFMGTAQAKVMPDEIRKGLKKLDLL